ncbi:acyl-CoA dehydrogenase family protein [Dermatobacter hominis]|uniref:acyl-CoA dehydrogenase family protein n=1 Tax=Dermatobacter hominis TaxID=2884263 RepID=UPI001D1025E6|nr:acyl-CoA dehydrogenase family protein [Dermatobacter hominis]UDY37135.1 acyl-CoA dehydrogenase family protein [Dermatobacter hominis]
MDFDDSAEEVALRAEARAWLDEHATRLDPDSLDEMRTYRAHTEEEDEALVEEARRWQRTKAEAGWAAPTWPAELGGRGLSPLLAGVFANEEAAYDVAGRMFSVGTDMVGPTLIEWGTDEQRSWYLPRILRADDIWCQLFSEPGAGSDLAGLSTRAIEDGDEWIITGQKVWTSGAHYSDLGILLARTDPDVPKHRGITAIAVPMRSPGVDVRPLRQIDGAIHFNEVFLDEVRVPVANTIGPVGHGWGVAMTMLTNERASIGGGGMYSFDQLAQLARAMGRDTDPVIRQRLADMYTRDEILRYLGYRVRTAAAAGRAPGPESSVMKLAVSSRYETGGDLMLEIEGAAGTLVHDDAPYGGRFQDLFMSQWAPRIGGGTDQVQRNIIGERVLGLPGDIRADKGVPFRDLPRS